MFKYFVRLSLHFSIGLPTRISCQSGSRPTFVSKDFRHGLSEHVLPLMSLGFAYFVNFAWLIKEGF